jgi:type I restriction enzyme M protein
MPTNSGWAQIVLASLNEKGRAAVVLDTGAASRGSGGKNRDKERDVRRWFVEQDFIEGVVYLPENLFYNTPAPGIILFLNKAKPRDRKSKLFLLNANRELTKGDPKNYLSEDSIRRIVESFQNWKEQDKFSRIVDKDEIAKNDFNISPSRYIHTGAGEEYRSIAEIVEELNAFQADAISTDAKLRTVLHKLGV